jgi:hypothetical protein
MGGNSEERDRRGGEEHLVEEERKTGTDKSLMCPKE